MYALEVCDVTVRFGGVEALRHVTLSVEQGERHVVLGPNGAGKTTLFNLIQGEIRPEGGQVRLLGEEVTHRSVAHRVRHGLGRTFQQSELLSGLTVRENVLLAARGRIGARFAAIPRRLADERMSAAADAALASLGLAQVTDSRADELSHGQAKQLEIAMSIAGGAKVILLDEPASGLSAGERKRITSVIDGLDRAVTLIMIEHDMDVAFHVADRLTVLHQGGVIASGRPDAVRGSAEVQQAYLGGALNV